MLPTEQIDAIWDKWAYKPQFFMMKGHVQEEENSLEKRKQQFRQDLLSVCKTMMRDIIFCDKCGGQGYYPEHDSPSRHGEDGECINCPVPCPCEVCQMTGLKSKAEILERIEGVKE